MFYAWDITIDKNTDEDDPEIKLLKLSKGLIFKIDVKFPKGCNGLAKIRLFRYESQLVPLNADEWMTGNDESVPTETEYDLVEAPYQLKFIGINEDDTWPHTVTVRVTISSRLVDPATQLTNIIKTLFERIGLL